MENDYYYITYDMNNNGVERSFLWKLFRYKKRIWQDNIKDR